ncbi:hypothetical protein FACS1894105_14630 [Clostridia bacterium]|nr:hypothetical protein FACS1894105_14630 [Clostridia bacterium]
MDYIERYNVPYVEDSTNGDTAYTRNFIRHNVLREFRRNFPRIDASVARMCENAALAEDYIASEAREFILRENDSDGVEISALNWLHPALTAEIIVTLYADSALPEYRRLERRHVDLIMKSLAANADTKIDLPCEITAIIHLGRIKFENRRKTAISVMNIYNLFNRAKLDFDKLKEPLRVTKGMAGDKYVYGLHTRDVRRNLINAKIPKEIRGILPIIRDEIGIVWCAGLPVADRVKVTSETKRILILTVTNTDDK